MPTTPTRVARTHREILEQQIIGHKLPSELLYRGVTTNAATTEIFMLGKTGDAPGESRRRLWLPESCLVMFECFATAYNVTDDSFVHAAKYVGGVANVNGTISAVKDYDGVTAGTQAAAMDSMQNFVGAGLPAIPVTFILDTTAQSVNIAVTGLAAKTIEWVLSFYPQAYTSEISSFFYGDRKAGNSI